MDKVSFGYEDVAPDEKTRRVRSVFSGVAPRYDLMNDLIAGPVYMRTLPTSSLMRFIKSPVLLFL